MKVEVFIDKVGIVELPANSATELEKVCKLLTLTPYVGKITEKPPIVIEHNYNDNMFEFWPFGFISVISKAQRYRVGDNAV
jgi:hypothetical protein